MLQQKFLHPKLDVLQIPKHRLIGGIFIAIFYAINWYAFLYLSREAIRILFSIYPDYNIAVFTDAEVNFYNFFFAAIAVILGQSACIQFWLEQPRRFRDKYYRRKVSIIHEQKTLNWIFMFVFSKVFVIVSVFSITALWKTQIFEFNAEYRSVFILAIIVLYLNTWNSIRHLFKNASLKWMLLSILLLGSSAFFLSKINFINYNEINKIILKEDISSNYNITIPESDIHQTIQSKMLSCDLFVAFSKDNKGDVLFFNKNEPFSLEDITSTFIEERNDVSLILKNRIMIHAKIDKHIKMSDINILKEKLKENEFYKIAYAVQPSNNIYNLDKIFNQNIPNYSYDFYLDDIKNGFFKNRTFYKIESAANNEYSIDNKIYSLEELKPFFRKIILEKRQNYLLEFYIDDDMTFDYYLQLHIAYKSALLDIRDEYASNEYLDKFNYLPRELRNEVQKIYPLSIHDVTEDMLRKSNK